MDSIERVNFRSFSKVIAIITLSALLSCESNGSDAVRLTALGANIYAFAFQIEKNAAPDCLIERTTRFGNWKTRVSVFSPLRSFRVLDRFAGEEPPATGFYRVSGRAQSPAAMKAAWDSLGIKKYEFRYSRTCFNCQPVELTGTVTVENGVVTKVENAENSGSPIENPDLKEYKSVEELFEMIASNVPGADLLEVGMDETLHFPAWVYMDGFYDITDDEISYSITDLVRKD